MICDSRVLFLQTFVNILLCSVRILAVVHVIGFYCCPVGAAFSVLFPVGLQFLGSLGCDMKVSNFFPGECFVRKVVFNFLDSGKVLLGVFFDHVCQRR